MGSTDDGNIVQRGQAIGMKKAFPTTIQENAQTLDYIYVSGGKLGMQLKLSPDDLKNVTQAQYADVTF